MTNQSVRARAALLLLKAIEPATLGEGLLLAALIVVAPWYLLLQLVLLLRLVVA